MEEQLISLENKVRGKRDFDSPPLHLWNPPLSGDIDILIKADGDWYHEGGLITRASLVRLFASILRREEDGEYYLLTPAEKWRIQVELHPLLVTDVEAHREGGDAVLLLTLNTGKTVVVGEQHPLFLDPAMDYVAGVKLEHGLSALFNRAAWYRLVDLADEVDGVTCVSSGGIAFSLTQEA